VWLVDSHRHDTDGYEFDASVFPSWRPGQFNNLGSHPAPTYRHDSRVLEVLFTVYPSVFPIPTALSYCQLLGRGTRPHYFTGNP
jgi:hypothetical protein